MKRIYKISIIAAVAIFIIISMHSNTKATVLPGGEKYCKWVNFDIGCMKIYEDRTQCAASECL